MRLDKGAPSNQFESAFELVLACVRWPLEPADAIRIQDLAVRPIDWAHLLKIVHHHQVAPLVSRNLEACAGNSVPADTLATLRTAAVGNARMCFQGISELVRLLQLFREAQVDICVLKGAPLAIKAFGDLTLRTMGDIDLLIKESDLSKANEILQSEGYSRREPAVWPSPRRMRSYLAHQKDFSYENYRNGIAIDLHWRLLRNPWLPVNVGLAEMRLDWIHVGPEHIPTLPLGQLFLYLCVHGALDGWLRLKWLADIGALLRGLSLEQLQSIANDAAARSALPEFNAALLLCGQKLGIDRPPLELLGNNDARTSHIVTFANRLMSSNNYCPVREHIPTTAWFHNEFILAPTSQCRRELLERSLFKPRIWQKIDLPDSLFPLYSVLSPFEWFEFRARRVLVRFTRKAGNASRASRRKLLRRFSHLTFSDATMLMEAASMLMFFRIALRFFSVQRLTTWMAHDEPASRMGHDDEKGQTLRQVEWAIGAIARHAPFSFVCFPQSLTAYFMLRRRHIASRLFYGVARETQQLKAHTWIKVGDRTVVGGEAESQFTVLAIFP